MESTNIKKLLTYPVPEDKALAVAEMSDEKLAKAYVVNAFLAALGGEGSVFWVLQAAVMQEAKRRGTKLRDRLC